MGSQRAAGVGERRWLVGVVACLAVILAGLGWAPAASGAAVIPAAADTVTLWSGTVTTSWSAKHGFCDGCDSHEYQDSGRLVYRVNGGTATPSASGRYLHKATVTGSGTMLWESTTDWEGLSKCRADWSETDVATDVVRLGLTQPEFVVPWIFTQPTYTELAGFMPCWDQGSASVGGFPHSGIGDEPGDPDPTAYRTVPDTDPSPERWKGTRTFSAQPNGQYLRSYTFTISVDLTRTTTDGCTIKGTEGRDRLVGTSGPDVICGYGEHDVLLGNGGADILRGGDGEDDLAGGPGRDTLEGGDHADALRGDEGNDAVDGGSGVDLVTYFTSRSPVTVDLSKGTARAGSHGNDTLRDVEGAFGSKTDDTLIGSGASNHLFGGPGKDSVRGMGGTDLLHGTAGADRLEGGAGGDLLEGDEGKDYLKGGASRDVCYDEKATRDSCELDEESDPNKRGKPPFSTSPSTPALNAGQAAGASSAQYWNLGHDDYLVVYSIATTQTIASWANTAGWENQVCHAIRYTPARGVCSATGALNAVSKYQMKWFLWNAKQNGGCAVGILDWGRHGVNQFKKRWKVRSATFARYHVAIPWVTAGRYSDVETSDGSSIRVYCS